MKVDCSGLLHPNQHELTFMTIIVHSCLKLQFSLMLMLPLNQSQTDTARTSWMYMWGGVGEDDEADEGVPIVHYYENKQRLTNSLIQQLKFPFPPVCF